MGAMLRVRMSWLQCVVSVLVEINSLRMGSLVLLCSMSRCLKKCGKAALVAYRHVNSVLNKLKKILSCGSFRVSDEQ